MENIIDAVSYEENIIQLQLRNVPKHPMIIAKIFTILHYNNELFCYHS